MQKRIALVTGGTGGLGTAICRELFSQGFNVIAGFSNGGDNTRALSWQESQKKQGFDFQIVYGDVSDFASSKAMVAEIEKKWGKVAVLINNAGITQDATFKKMNANQWESVLSINLDSLYNVTRQVINGMIENNFGRIINISSINGQKGQFGQTNYSAAKSGMYGFTKALAQEVANKGITVNAISPGYVETEMTKKVSPEILEKIVAQIPVGRLAIPHEIARVVGFLSHEEAGYITGANIPVNGGQHMY